MPYEAHWFPLRKEICLQRELWKNVMMLAPNPLNKGAATMEKWGASEKQLHAASRTSRKRQSADTKAKKLSKFKKGKGESNQAARAGSK